MYGQDSTLAVDAYALLEQMRQLRADITAEAESIKAGWLGNAPAGRPEFVESADNLAAYLALRRRDLRRLQWALRMLGLSSLGRIEARVFPHLDAMIATLARLCGEADPPPYPEAEAYLYGGNRLNAEAAAVLGPPTPGRRVRIMVTMETQQGQDIDFVRQMATCGMNIARINCARDNPEIWTRMIANVHQVAAETGQPIKVAMDLGGPKSRTADIIKPKKHRIHRCDKLVLTRNTPQPMNDYAVVVRATLAEALDQVQVGERVWFDDGIIGTVVREKYADHVVLEVTQASSEGEKLRNDKGINFPDTDLQLDPLTPDDLACLDFVVQHADIIHYSFVQTPEDMRHLLDEIEQRKPERKPAIVAKIETALAITNLPGIIVAAGQREPIGVMIARGDLAVEIGYQRLAEMQEEIMWICEAAHVPVIWATQVLENLAKFGRPSRAEVTDAAMAERAECVMLNKGPYILDAITILDDILRRMAEHQSKKTASLRRLKSW